MASKMAPLTDVKSPASTSPAFCRPKYACKISRKKKDGMGAKSSLKNDVVADACYNRAETQQKL